MVQVRAWASFRLMPAVVKVNIPCLIAVCPRLQNGAFSSFHRGSLLLTLSGLHQVYCKSSNDLFMQAVYHFAEYQRHEMRLVIRHNDSAAASSLIQRARLNGQVSESPHIDSLEVLRDRLVSSSGTVHVIKHSPA